MISQAIARMELIHARTICKVQCSSLNLAKRKRVYWAFIFPCSDSFVLVNDLVDVLCIRIRQRCFEIRSVMLVEQLILVDMFIFSAVLQNNEFFLFLFFINFSQLVEMSASFSLPSIMSFGNAIFLFGNKFTRNLQNICFKFFYMTTWNMIG